MDEELAQRLEESKQIALDVEDGKRTRYWKHLESKILSWKGAEEKKYELLNKRLLTNELEVAERNEVLKRIYYLTQLLNINQEIIEENLGVIGSFESPVKHFKTDSFVGSR